MPAGGQVGKGNGVRLEEGGPVAVIQLVGKKQPFPRREFPLVLPAERNGDGVALAHARLGVGWLLNVRPRRVRIGLGIIPAQSVRCADPDVPALVFKNLVDGGIRQSVVPVVLDPDFLKKTMHAGVVRHPDAAVPGPMKGVDVVEPGRHERPVAPVKFPELVRCGAPDPPVGQFREAQNRLGDRAFRNRERPPLFLVIPGQAGLAAQPEVAVACGKQRGIDAGRRGVLQRLELLSVKTIEAACRRFSVRRFIVPALDAKTAIRQEAQCLHVPHVVADGESRAERAGIRVELD